MYLASASVVLLGFLITLAIGCLKSDFVKSMCFVLLVIFSLLAMHFMEFEQVTICAFGGAAIGLVVLVLIKVFKQVSPQKN